MRKKQDNRRTQLILGAFIAFIMIFSVGGYFVENISSKVKYNTFKFSRSGNLWITSIEGKQLRFNHFPTEVEDINLSSDIIGKLKNTAEIDLTYDINDTFAEGFALIQYEMVQILQRQYIRTGLTTNTTFRMPIITCKDATNLIPVIYFKNSNRTEIYLEDNCIITEIKTFEDITRLKDRFLYTILGIIR